MLKQPVHCLWLFVPQVAIEFNVDHFAVIGLIQADDIRSLFSKDVSQVLFAAPRQAEVIGSIIGAAVPDRS
jgi:hypothetical protein